MHYKAVYRSESSESTGSLCTEQRPTERKEGGVKSSERESEGDISEWSEDTASEDDKVEANLRSEEEQEEGSEEGERVEEQEEEEEPSMAEQELLQRMEEANQAIERDAKCLASLPSSSNSRSSSECRSEVEYHCYHHYCSQYPSSKILASSYVSKHKQTSKAIIILPNKQTN